MNLDAFVRHWNTAAGLRADAWPPALIESLWRDHLAPALARNSLPMIGIGGPPGTGKSTLAQLLAACASHLTGTHLIVLALDDFYLTRHERAQLAAAVHPLLAQRGVPGTHDHLRLRTCIAQIMQQKPLTVPRFDKARDDRAASERSLSPPHDGLLLEGWCVGAPDCTLAELGGDAAWLDDVDPAAAWRRWWLEQHSAHYVPLWQRLDECWFLKPPSLAAALDGRIAQEAAIPAGERMPERAVRRFFHHFEPLCDTMCRDSNRYDHTITTAAFRP